MTKKSTFLFVVTSLVVILAAAAFPSSVRAALSIIDVAPSVVDTDTDNSVTITGTDFAVDAVVSVGNTPVTVTSNSPTALIVLIPAGFAPGTYSVSVTNPNGDNSMLPGALTVAPPGRPQIVIKWYHLNVDGIRFGQDFKLQVRLDNAGGPTALGIQVTFASTELLMLDNGGVIAAGNMDTVAETTIEQPMTALAPMPGVSRVNVTMNVSYSDDHGGSYSDSFSLSVPVAGASSSGGGARPSATPTGLHRPQLVIKSYDTDVEMLQPGVQFTLNLSVQNMGNVGAKGVTMILGGGSSSGSGGETPQPGGTSGGGGDFTNFAPLGTSNVQSLGDVPPNATMTASQKLIVNVSTAPGAYPIKITFSYTDDTGNTINDEQVITLLVYSLPSVDIGFYQAVGPLVAGQPNALPLQVVNLGKKSAVLGKMRVETAGGTIQNGEMLVGPLDPGGYFTMDALVIPDAPGTLELNVTIDYIDDFNQARSLSSTLTLEVTDMALEPTPDASGQGGGGGGGGGGEVVVTPDVETFWQKTWRFLLGLLGLDSGAPSADGTQAEPTPLINPYPSNPLKG